MTSDTEHTHRQRKSHGGGRRQLAILVLALTALALALPFTGQPVSAAAGNTEGQPTINGILRVGETLTADISTFSDPDGIVIVTYYEWTRRPSPNAASTVASEGSRATTHTLVEADLGQYISVRVSYLDGGGILELATSNIVGPILGAALPAKPTGLTAQGFKVGWSDTIGPYVALAWHNPGDDSITHYDILRRDVGTHAKGEFHVVATYNGGNGPQYFDRTVDEDRHYVYRIQAVNEHGTSSRSKFAKANTTSDPIVPYDNP